MSNTEADATPKPRVVAQTPRRSADERIVHLSRDEHADRGKAARKAVPRGSHSTWAPPAGRPNPVDLLEEQAASRVPELVPIRYGRMLVSPFTFYRGGAYLMASDLAQTPVSGLNVQLCGDAHLSNFGGFASAERRMVFDINDFDETLPGPWEWDVKRLAASFEIAGRDRGLLRFGAARGRSPGGALVPRGHERRSPICAIWTCGTRISTSRRSSPRYRRPPGARSARPLSGTWLRRAPRTA